MPFLSIPQPLDPAAIVARLTDSAPPVVVTICAWCADFDPRDPKNRGASHGLCPSCRVRLEQETA